MHGHHVTSSKPQVLDRSLQRFRVLVAILAGALLAGTLTPTAASAEGNSCVIEDVCVYESANLVADPTNLDARINPTNPWSAFAGYYENMFKMFPSPHTYNNPESCNQIHALQPTCNLNDTITSARNKDTSYRVRLFTNASYRGSWQTLAPLSSDNTLTYNNQTSSLCWLGGRITVANCRN